MYPGSITDIPGLLVGQAQDTNAHTGVTVLYPKGGARGGVDVRGAAPGTRETDLLAPGNTVEVVNAVCLCGGSAYGLDAASGVMNALEGMGEGFRTADARVPIVCAAVLYDLGVGRADVRPDAAMGAAALGAAASFVEQGALGAGCGATVGKAPGAVAARGGVGTASIELPGGVIVAAIMAVNAVGDVYDGERCVACGRTAAGEPVTVNAVMAGGMPGQNTTIGVVATNARLDKAQLCRTASVAHDGIALAVRPAHTVMDGDTLFALSVGDLEAQPFMVHMAAVEAVRRAIVNAVTA